MIRRPTATTVTFEHCIERGDDRGGNFEIEYKVEITARVIPETPSSWNEYHGGDPGEPAHIEIEGVELLEVTLSAPPDYEHGIEIAQGSTEWLRFKEDVERYLLREIDEDSGVIDRAFEVANERHEWCED